MKKREFLTGKNVIITNTLSVILLVLIVTLLLVFQTKVPTPNNDFRYSSNDFNYGPSKLSVLSNNEVDRQNVIESDGGLDEYPKPGNHINDEELKKLILEENKAILDYDKIDEEGNLFKYIKNEETNITSLVSTNKKLIKHTMADSAHEKYLPHDAIAFERTVLVNGYEHGNNITGLYVPAGEIVKVQIPKEYISSGFYASIGLRNSRMDDINIPLEKEFTRMPIIAKKISLDQEVNYIGNPLGGALYIDLNKINVPVEITITGAVEYSHFILGTTSKIELERMLVEAKGIIFDLEVPGIIRLTMPVTQLKDLTADDLIDAAIYWEKFGSMSNYINQGEWYRTHLITSIYDSYVPAGAAVAFVGRSFSVAPINWGNDAINVKTLINNGSWGNFHEFNHHHQSKIGASGGGEVTNNVISILSYMEYSNISSKRNIDHNLGDSGWNAYLDPTHALKQLNTREAGKNTQLNMYLPLINSFGVNNFIEGFKQDSGSNDSNFYKLMSDHLGVNLTYYLNDLNEFGLSNDDINYIKAKDYPSYIPVSSVYQVGQEQSLYNKELNSYKDYEFKTAQPYIVDINETVNISNSIIVPKGFKYNITNISKPNYGKLELIDNEYIYTPLESNFYDEFRVTIEVTNGYISSTQTLIFGFGNQMQRAKQEVPTVVYNNKDGLVTLDNALDYEELEIKANLSTAGGNVAFDGANHDVMVTSGQIVLPESKKYTFYIAADDYAVLYVGKSRDNLKQVARVDNYTSNYNKDLEGSYFSIDLKENESLYFKLIVINKDGRMSSKIGYDNGISLADVPKEFVYEFNNEIGFHDFYSPIGSFEYRYHQSYNIFEEVLEDNATIEASSNISEGLTEESINAIIDGNNSNGLHSKVNLDVFPGHFTIDYKKSKSFNTFELYALRNEYIPRGLPKDIKISISNDGINFKEVFNGKTKAQYVNRIHFDETLNARYLKIEVLTSHRELYIGIGEIRISNSFINGKAFNVNNSGIQTKGSFNYVTNGSYVNGYTLETNKGSLKFNFKGDSIGLYAAKDSKYGIMQVRVNNGKWSDINLNSDNVAYNQLVYFTSGLLEDNNVLEIRSKNKNLINIDYFVAKDVISVNSKIKTTKINWLLMILLIIPIVLVNLVITGLYFIKKKRIKPTTVK